METTLPRFALCVANQGAEDLDLRKVYRVLPDDLASQSRMIRIVDDSGEDYLYPEAFFVPLDLSQAAVAKLEDLLTIERGAA